MMWELYTRALKGSINQHVPTKTIKPRHRSVLEWFNRKAKKHKKMGRAHRQAKLAKNSFDNEHYRTLRREEKKELQTTFKAFHRSLKKESVNSRTGSPLVLIGFVNQTCSLTWQALQDVFQCSTKLPWMAVDCLSNEKLRMWHQCTRVRMLSL